MTPFSPTELLRIAKSPGVQYLLTGKEGIIYQQYAGLAHVQKKVPVDASTTFNAYSLTKTFTAAAVMNLVEEQKISLDDIANSFFPEFTFSAPFTIKQLLSHQSGIGNPLPLKWIHLTDEDFNEKEFLNRVISSNTRLRFKPGSKMSYSNVGFLLLGMLIEKISGKDYESFIIENIIRKSVGSGYLSFKKSEQQSAGYHPKYSFTNVLLGLFFDRHKYMKAAEGKWSAFNSIYLNGKAYGGMIANATGLSEYLGALLNGKIISDASVKTMLEEQKGGMSLGWFRGRLGKHDYFCHAGGGGGYYCEIKIYPGLKMHSVVMTNRTGFSDERLLDKIDSHFLQ